ncbi:MAG: hypothetical protein ACOH2J_02790 [Allorhizobium sp.]
MGEDCDFDMSLFAPWPERRGFGPAVGPGLHNLGAHGEGGEAGGGVWGEERFLRAGRGVLERKSADAASADGVSVAESYCRLLNDLTLEMREQFELFRKLRVSADRLIDAGGEGFDEAAAKLARGDAKTATDAISLIVRTLEKVDSLQRQIARDRDEAEERLGESEDYAQNRDKLLALIDQRAEERALVLAATILAEHGDRSGPGGGTGPPDEGQQSGGLPGQGFQ